MSKSQKKLKKKQKTKLRKIFIRTILITLIVLGIGTIVFSFIYNQFLSAGNHNIFKEKDPKPINKTVAVFGVDKEGYRTDVIFLVNFNSDKNKVTVLSVPRDTKVEWTESMQEEIQEIKGYPVYTSKINEMTSYAGINRIEDFTIPELEQITGMTVDNYVIVTLDAFREIVDAIGGVEVDVPVLNGDGLQYDDNYQDLHIHLSPGLQTLDGEAAEGLVRFRKGYAEGDVGRIKTQQLFIEAFLKKITSPAIITKLPNIAKVVMNSVETDVNLSEALGYIPYLKGLNQENLTFDIIPGEASYEGGKSYYVVDEAQMPIFIEEILNGTEEPTEDEIIIDDTVSIEVLNSTTTGGLAGKAKLLLEEKGYQVEQIGNYTSNTLDTTIIYAKDTSLANQFLAYYPHAQIEQSDAMDYDIQIILGNDSTGE